VQIFVSSCALQLATRDDTDLIAPRWPWYKMLMRELKNTARYTASAKAFALLMLMFQLPACTVDPKGGGKACDSEHLCRVGEICVDASCETLQSSKERDAGLVPPSPSDAGSADASIPEPNLDAALGAVDSGIQDAGMNADAGIGSCEVCSNGSCAAKAVGSSGTPTCANQNLCDGLAIQCPATCTVGGCEGGLRCGSGRCVRKTGSFQDDFSAPSLSTGYQIFLMESSALLLRATGSCCSPTKTCNWAAPS
jgi:hypothetical protein